MRRVSETNGRYAPTSLIMGNYHKALNSVVADLVVSGGDRVWRQRDRLIATTSAQPHLSYPCLDEQPQIWRVPGCRPPQMVAFLKVWSHRWYFDGADSDLHDPDRRSPRWSTPRVGGDVMMS